MTSVPVRFLLEFPSVSFPRIYSIGEKQARQRRSGSRSQVKREVEKRKRRMGKRTYSKLACTGARSHLSPWINLQTGSFIRSGERTMCSRDEVYLGHLGGLVTSVLEGTPFFSGPFDGSEPGFDHLNRRNGADSGRSILVACSVRTLVISARQVETSVCTGLSVRPRY